MGSIFMRILLAALAIAGLAACTDASSQRFPEVLSEGFAFSGFMAPEPETAARSSAPTIMELPSALSQVPEDQRLLPIELEAALFVVADPDLTPAPRTSF